MPTPIASAEPCRCRRAALCEACWRDFERSCTEGQLREWLASWDADSASNDAQPCGVHSDRSEVAR